MQYLYKDQEHQEQPYQDVLMPVSSLNSVRKISPASLSYASSLQDEDTLSHSERVGIFSGKLAQIAGLDPESSARLGKYSYHHDIGKIAIPESIRKKPSTLTIDEYAHMKNHTVYGAEILRHYDKHPVATEIALHHHENWNGTGYPLGIVGPDIPISARIVRIVDYFDAMSTKRAYKDPHAYSSVLEKIACGSGTKFDPDLCSTFLDHAQDFKYIHSSLCGR